MCASSHSNFLPFRASLQMARKTLWVSILELTSKLQQVGEPADNENHFHQFTRLLNPFFKVLLLLLWSALIFSHLMFQFLWAIVIVSSEVTFQILCLKIPSMLRERGADAVRRNQQVIYHDDCGIETFSNVHGSWDLKWVLKSRAQGNSYKGAYVLRV